LAEARLVQAPAWTLSPEQERRLMFAAVGRFLANVAGPAGTLLVLDDLQWAGPDALDLLAVLLRSEERALVGRGAALRVVGAYRDTEIAPRAPLAVLLADLAHAQQVTRVPLTPLAPLQAQQLLTQILGGDGEGAVHDQASVDAQVLARTGGVPFFVVSYAHALRRGTREGAQDGGLSSADAVPWDVAHGIRQRVAALSEVAREVLGVVAVAGRPVQDSLLSAVVGCSETEVLTALEEACHARLLEDGGAEGYRFAHDVIWETVDAALGTAQRTVLHRRLAQGLEQEAERCPGLAQVAIIAYHYAHTPEHTKATRWLERAGDLALAGCANAAALEHYAAARARRLADGTGSEALSRLDEKLGDLRLLTGEYAQAQEDYARARAQTADVARRAELGRKEGVTAERRGEFARALAAFAAAEAEGGTEDSGRALPGAVRAAVALSRGLVHHRRGDYAAVAVAAERALLLLVKESPSLAIDRAMAEAELLQGIVAVHAGDFARAEACCRHSLTLYERSADQEGIAQSWHELGWIAQLAGRDLTWAEECHRHSLAIRDRIGSRQGVAESWRSLGWVAFERGNLADAEECYQRGTAAYESIGDQCGSALCWVCLGWVACAHGDVGAAARWCRRARRLARRMVFPRVEAAAALGQAQALLRGVSPGAAAERRRGLVAALLAQGRALARRHGLAQLVTQAALLTAELHLAQGRVGEAQRATEEALRLATGGQTRLQEAVARRLAGQGALAGSDLASAATHLRAALAMQTGMGTALEAARTRLILAGVLWRRTEGRVIPEEAQTLLVEACATFVRSGAALDLAQAEQLAEAWATR
jgi:tetratricopeptide (TPR) repeat protein